MSSVKNKNKEKAKSKGIVNLFGLHRRSKRGESGGNNNNNKNISRNEKKKNNSNHEQVEEFLKTSTLQNDEKEVYEAPIDDRVSKTPDENHVNREPDKKLVQGNEIEINGDIIQNGGVKPNRDGIPSITSIKPITLINNKKTVILNHQFKNSFDSSSESDLTTSRNRIERQISKSPLITKHQYDVSELKSTLPTLQRPCTTTVRQNGELSTANKTDKDAHGSLYLKRLHVNPLLDKPNNFQTQHETKGLEETYRLNTLSNTEHDDDVESTKHETPSLRASDGIHVKNNLLVAEPKQTSDKINFSKISANDFSRYSNRNPHVCGIEKTDTDVVSANHNACETTDNSFSLEKLDITITLGTGTFGRVFLAEKHGACENGSEAVYAIKIMRMKDIIKLNQVEHVNSEKSILQITDHPFIVKCYWTHRDNKCLYMLLEYVPGGELFTYLRNKVRFTASDALFYVAEIISVLEYLHKREIVYRDLKPENLLLDNEGHLKFTDFGFAKILHDTTWTLCGTPEYLSPEAIQGKGHDCTCDWWALGILTYEMLVGEAPFVDDHPFGLYQKILACCISWPSYLKDTEQMDFISKLVVVERSSRLGKGQNGSEDVKNHSWLRYVNWDDVYCRRLKPPIKPKIAFKSDTSNFDDFDEDWELSKNHDVTLTDINKFMEWET